MNRAARLLLACATLATARVLAGPSVVYLDPQQLPEDAGYRSFQLQFEQRVKARHREASLDRLKVPADNLEEAAQRLRDVSPPTAFVTAHTTLAQAAAARFPEVPIVLATMADPSDLGLIDANGRARSNVTGFTSFLPFELKHFELIRELVPRARVVGILMDRHWASEPLSQRIVRDAPALFGLEARTFLAESREQVAAQLGSVEARGMDAWFIPDTPSNRTHAEDIARRLRKLGRPSVGGHVSHARAGGLAVYEPERIDPWPRVAGMVNAILSGVPAREIAFDRPMALRLIINLKAAEALGVNVPAAAAKRANEIIR